MPKSLSSELLPAYLEIEQTFHRRQREARAAQHKDQEQIPMANQQIDPIRNLAVPANVGE